MFDSAITAPEEMEAPSPAELASWFERLAAVDGEGGSEAEHIDHLVVIEQLKSAAAAAQARVTARLADARSRSEAARGVPASRRGAGLAAEIGLARRESPVQGRRHLDLGLTLAHCMPATLAALTEGCISEFRAMLIVKETAVLSEEHRRRVDAELAPRLGELGDRGAAAEARRIGCRLDPEAAARRARTSRADRNVTLRSTDDAMGYLTGFLPAEQGQACQEALKKEADTRRARGDERSRAQIMADAMVERLTGQASADGIQVEIQLVMTKASLLDGDDEPARLAGFGPIPAATARDLVRNAARAWLRRLFTTPDGSGLVAMETRRRVFEGGLRCFLVARDDVCRNLWCDAPIRHLDHVVRVADGGETTSANGQGLCEGCNYVKEAPGWRAQLPPGDPDVIEIITPTGHRYRSRAPDLPGHVDVFSPLEQRFASILAAA
jgi:hypothetical protein